MFKLNIARDGKLTSLGCKFTQANPVGEPCLVITREGLPIETSQLTKLSTHSTLTLEANAYVEGMSIRARGEQDEPFAPLKIVHPIQFYKVTLVEQPAQSHTQLSLLNRIPVYAGDELEH